MHGDAIGIKDFLVEFFGGATCDHHPLWIQRAAFECASSYRKRLDVGGGYYCFGSC